MNRHGRQYVYGDVQDLPDPWWEDHAGYPLDDDEPKTCLVWWEYEQDEPWRTYQGILVVCREHGYLQRYTGTRTFDWERAATDVGIIHGKKAEFKKRYPPGMGRVTP